MLKRLKDLFSPPAGRIPTEKQKQDLAAAIADGDVEACLAVLTECPRVANDRNSACQPFLSAAIPFEKEQFDSAAVSARKREIVNLLLDRGADIHQTDAYGATALHSAAYYDPAVATVLLGRGADANAADDEAQTPLHRAASGLRVDLIAQLVKAGATPNLRDKRGWTPLMTVCLMGELFDELGEHHWGRALDAARMLLKAGANPNIVTNEHDSPLILAIRNQRRDLFDLLLDHGADPCLWLEPSCALWNAISAGLLDFADAMISRGASLDQRGPDGVALVEMLSYIGDEESINALEYALAKGARVDLAEEDGETPLLVAVREGHVEAVTLLLQHHADPNNTTNAKGQTPLSVAVADGREEIAQLLLAHGANPGQALLYITGGAENPRLCASLLDHGADPNAKSADGKFTPLLLALVAKHTQIAKLLLERGALPGTAGDNNVTPVYQAVLVGNESILDELLARNADPNIATIELRRTALHAAAFDGSTAIISKLLSVPGICIDPRDVNGMTPLALAAHQAAHHGRAEAARRLLDAGAAPDAIDNAGCMPIHHAAAEGHTDIVKLLAARCRACVEAAGGEKGFTPLAFAATGGHPETAKALMALGARADTRYQSGHYLFFHAVHAARAEVIRVLLDGNAGLTSLTDHTGGTALHLAAEMGRDDVVKMLLACGAYVNATDNDGCTPMDATSSYSTHLLLASHGGETYA